ncbi:MAG: S8/S53 family peptidase [Luteibaculaceae bacterium]
MRAFLLLTFLAFSLSSWGQASRSITLNAYIEQAKDLNEEISMAFVGNARELSTLIVSIGGKVTLAKGNIVNARLSLASLDRVLESPFLDYYEFSPFAGHPLSTDPMLPNNNVLGAHLGVQPINTQLKGEGVIAGIIDSGLDLTHPDFKNPDGTTRVLYVWDQTPNTDPSRIPQPYGYGTEWTMAEINAGVSTHVDQPQHWGHGSMVGGIFFGNGSATGDFKGVAPKADIIVVSTWFGATNWLLTVADAVNYIFTKAEAEGKAVVINASVGAYLGSHDGLDPAALLINGMVNEAPGRAFVCAVGNSGHIDYHLGYEITQDTSFSWFRHRNNMATGFSGVFFESWADVGDIENAHFAWSAVLRTGSRTERGSTNFYTIDQFTGVVLVDSIVNVNNQKLADVQFWAQQENTRYRIQMAIINPDSTNYFFSFKTTGSGRIDGWSGQWMNINEIEKITVVPQNFPGRQFYKETDNDMTTVSSFACSPDVLTTANLINRNSYIDFNGILQTFAVQPGNMAATSSHGPTRDFRLKPDIAATGDYNFGSAPQSVINAISPSQVAPGGFHQLAGGSSAAAPVVAGVLALYLELCPEADIHEMKEALFSAATGNQFSGILPNLTWGHGRVNGLGTILNGAFSVTVELEANAVGCGSNSVKLSAPAGFDNYLWSNGATEPQICVTTPGIYFVRVNNNGECFGFSDSVLVEPLSVNQLSRIEFNIFPNPASSQLNINLSNPINESLQAEIMDITGKVVFREQNFIATGAIQQTLGIQSLSSGIYFLRINSTSEQTVFKFIKE